MKEECDLPKMKPQKNPYASRLQEWRSGDISLGKMAELLAMDKQVLRGVIFDMSLPVIETDEQGAIEEARQLLEG